MRREGVPKIQQISRINELTINNAVIRYPVRASMLLRKRGSDASSLRASWAQGSPQKSAIYPGSELEQLYDDARTFWLGLFVIVESQLELKHLEFDLCRGKPLSR